MSFLVCLGVLPRETVAGSPGRWFLPVVGLGAHAHQPEPRDAVGAGIGRGDQPAALQLAEELQRQAGVMPPFAGDDAQVFDAAALVLFDEHAAALSEQVQDPLLGP